MLVQQGWPGLCGTGLLCQRFRLLAHFPMPHHGRWVCMVPPGVFVLAQSPTEHSKSQENVGKKSKIVQACSVPGGAVNPAPLVPVLLWRVQSSGGVPWTWTSSICRGVDLPPWCPLRAGWLPSVTQHQTALLWPPFCYPLSFLHQCQPISHLLSWCLGQQMHHDHRTAMHLYWAVIW